MVSKKRFQGFLKKVLFVFISLALMLVTMALPLVMPPAQQAKASVPVFNIMDGPPGMMIGPGMLFPALNINSAADAGETLVSVRVSILVPAGSNFNPTTGLASLSASDGRAGVNVYKDNKSAGVPGFPDPPQDFRDTYLPLASAPTWNQTDNSTWQAMLTLSTPDALPVGDTGNNTGDDYFIIISASSNPPPGETFQVQIPAGGITLNAGTFPTTPQPSNPNVITIGQGGMIGTPLVISEIQTAGGGADAANDEFIELYNRTPGAISLSSWSVQYKDGASANLSSGSPAASYNLSGNISGYSYFLLANANGFDDATPPDNTYPASTFALSASGGTVFLVNNQTPLTGPSAPSILDK
ncbi:MAG: lamin tail domain-containing protein, partial [Chloroflexi bacterium]|nr:lamin tail domain-containing protein [Chloroflexota bacterium]